ncbi:hypothetical protein JCM15457_1769 [Liquorilactobacillus sucicola DSM 21376 = JCM 15457]|nr:MULTISPECIES: hypothetical protein [Liquorilactobacillus]KRN07552.1 hypothetical protein FD15_GL000837 [Liquorilactobacillus sucicola DSM 21376 = JCM 15457]GAJ26819.1 hypothetical protein JCM15457_1769 [Liquorilactobacillus sucicola DSM 21376 = JCM 15457]
MENLFGFIIFIGIIYVVYKILSRPKYRVILVDPVTGYRKYLKSVDGINNTFQYTGDSKSALIFNNGSRAEQFITGVDQNAMPEVEVKKFIGWKKLTRG